MRSEWLSNRVAVCICLAVSGFAPAVRAGDGAGTATSQPAFEPAAIPVHARIAYVNGLIVQGGEATARAEYDAAIAALDQAQLAWLQADWTAWRCVDDNLLALATHLTWPEWIGPAAQDGLERMAEALRRWRSAAKFERFGWTLPEGDRLCLFPNESMARLRKVARWLCIAATAEVRAQRWNSGWDTLLLVHRIGAHQRQVPFVINQLTGAATDQLAHTTAFAWLRQGVPPPSPAYLQERSRLMARAAPDEDVRRAEQLFLRDFLDLAVEWADDPAAHEEFDVFCTMFCGGGMLAELNEDLFGPPRFASPDALRAALRRVTAEELWQKHMAVQATIDAWWARPLPHAVLDIPALRERIGALIQADPLTTLWTGSGVFTPWSMRIVQAKRENQNRAFEVVVALHEFRAKNARWPERLAELQPEFLPDIPRDEFTGELMRYERDVDGSFRLYSVGQNQRDDGGENDEPLPFAAFTGAGAASQPAAGTTDDLVYWPPDLIDFVRPAGIGP